MNYEQSIILRDYVYKYLEDKYSNIKPISKEISINEYLDLFDKKLKTETNILKGKFLLPNGNIKNLEIDLFDFKIPNYFVDNFNITKENIYKYIDLNHNCIKYVGFDLDYLLNLGCIRIVNNSIKKELYIEIHAKPNNKIIDIVKQLSYYYSSVIIDFYKSKNIIEGKEYSLDNIKDIIKDINLYYKGEINE